MADGRVWPLVALPVLAVALWAMVRALVPPQDRAAVGAVLALSFALHVAVAVVLFTGSVAIGRRGFTFYDDRTYADIAVLLARYLHGEETPGFGPPLWGSHAYLFGTYVYLEAALFFLIGPEPLAAILANGALALATAVLVFDMARRLFDRRAALVALAIVAFYPSLVLWSSLNLKDAFVVAIIGVCLWALVRFQERPRWPWLAVAFGSIVLVESVREYIFIGLALLIPMVVAVTPRLGLAARARWTLPAVAVTALYLTAIQAGIGSGPQLLALFEYERHQMGIGARTRFVDAPPVIVKEGDTFVVALPSPSASPDAAPAPTPAASPRVVHVAPNTRIVVVTGSPAPPPTASVRPPPTQVAGPVAPVTPVPTATAAPKTPSPATPTIAPTPRPAVTAAATVAAAAPTASVAEPEVVFVSPGDVVVVGTADVTPAPAAQTRTIVAGDQGVTLRPESETADVLTRRTLAYLPQGLAYGLFAPFPWQSQKLADLAVVPEMLAWYVIVAAALATLVRVRARWRELFAIVGFVGGLLLLLALVEGNTGTLYRHRAMLIVWTVVLGAPALASVLGRLDRLRRPLPWMPRERGAADATP